MVRESAPGSGMLAAIVTRISDAWVQLLKVFRLWSKVMSRVNEPACTATVVVTGLPIC